MKKMMILFAAVLFIGLTACNNSSNSNNSDDQQETEATEENGDTGPQALPEVNPDARVFFKNLEDGQTVKSPVKVEMGVEGIELEPAGEVKQGYGHHHILVNVGDHFEKGKVIPDDETHIHYGKAQTETELELPAGEYELTLQYADGIHRSYGEQLASTVHVTVEE